MRMFGTLASHRRSMHLIRNGLCVGALLASVLVPLSCKTQSSGTASVTNDLPTSLDCGPQRTFYFHWSSQQAATFWLHDVGNWQVSDFASLQERSTPLNTVNATVMNRQIRYYKPANAALGPGIYLAVDPIQTAYYGDTLLIFRFRDNQGHGLPCENWLKDQNEHRDRNLLAKASPDLPLLAQYMQIRSVQWFISPRAPIPSRGEVVQFSLPRVGDADEFVAEITKDMATIDKFVDGFSSIYPRGGEIMRGLCSNKPVNGGMTFVQEAYCQAMAKRLTQMLAQASPSTLNGKTRAGFAQIVATYGAEGFNSQDILNAIRKFDSKLVP